MKRTPTREGASSRAAWRRIHHVIGTDPEASPAGATDLPRLGLVGLAAWTLDDADQYLIGCYADSLLFLHSARASCSHTLLLEAPEHPPPPLQSSLLGDSKLSFPSSGADIIPDESYAHYILLLQQSYK